MEGLRPAPQYLQLVEKVELQAVEAAVALSEWAQMQPCSAGRGAAAEQGRQRQQQGAKAALEEEVAPSAE